MDLSSQEVSRQTKLGLTPMTPRAREGTTLTRMLLKPLVPSKVSQRILSSRTHAPDTNTLRPLQQDHPSLTPAIAVTPRQLAMQVVPTEAPMRTPIRMQL